MLSLPQLSSNGHPSTPIAATNTAAANRPDGGRSRVIVTGCWATSDPDTAGAITGVDAVIGHHQDVAAELTRLMDLWQRRGAEHTSPQVTDHPAAPEPYGNEGWIKKAGSPAGKLTGQITLSEGIFVNKKIENGVLSTQAHAPRGPGDDRVAPFVIPANPPPAGPHLKIQDGCDAHCTYCIIPSLRPALMEQADRQNVRRMKQTNPWWRRGARRTGPDRHLPRWPTATRPHAAPPGVGQ